MRKRQLITRERRGNNFHPERMLSGRISRFHLCTASDSDDAERVPSHSRRSVSDDSADCEDIGAVFSGWSPGESVEIPLGSSSHTGISLVRKQPSRHDASCYSLSASC